MALLPVLLLVACARPVDRPLTPLLDGDHALDMLVESRHLERPPATGGNRFLSGWSPWRQDGELLLEPAATGARIEGVRLGDDVRALQLALRLPAAATTTERSGGGGPGAAGQLQAFAGGRPLPPVPLAQRLELPLPHDLPRGRFVLELRFPPGAAVLAAGFDRALPAGAVSAEGGVLRQGGVSAVELVRPLRGNDVRLVGRFVPPDDPRPGQRFELWAGSGAQARLLWSWRAGVWQRLQGARRLDLALAARDGWLRLRLLAATPGPPARWEGLALAGGEVPPAAAATPAPRAPAATRESSAAPAPPPRLVLLYVFDALRADAVGHLGGGGATPALDRLARGGITFAAHRSTAPNTLPSTKTLLTGRVWRQRGGWALSAREPTLAEAFRAAGYRTGLFSGNVHVSAAYGLARGFEVAPEETLFDRYATSAALAHNDNAERVHAAALLWLRGLPAGARAFAYLHVVHPHNPYAPPAPFATRFAPLPGALDGSTETLLALRRGRLRASAADQARLRGLYLGGLAYADAELGRLLAALGELYRPEEVLIAATSDHGEELFDHHGVLHGYTLYEEQLRIPLVLSWPRVLAPRVVAAATDTADLHAALSSLPQAGSPPAPALWRAAAGEPAPAALRFAAAASLKGGIYAVRSERFKVVWAPRTGTLWGVGEGLGRGRDAEQVFDLAADPLEQHNLAGSDHPEVRWLRARLLRWAAAEAADEEAAAEPADGAETQQRLRALGYVE